MALLFLVEVVVKVWPCYELEKLTWILIVFREAILMLLLRSLKAIFSGGLQGFTVTRKLTGGMNLGAFLPFYTVSSNSHGYA